LAELWGIQELIALSAVCARALACWKMKNLL